MGGTAGTLIFTWGNPSRGDDAIGPSIHDRLAGEGFDDVDLLTDFQLQIEHTIDLENRQRVLFVDADVATEAPFELSELAPARDHSYTSHAMSPRALLTVYEQVNGRAPPPAFLLAIRGYEFGLGLPLSAPALRNIDEAFDLILRLMAARDMVSWRGLCCKNGQEA